ncbi:alpha/beta fold hydrolase [Sphingomonas sp. RG327]|uniref:Alpha/beta fold hydrolase n=2 Tax=Sphingomonas anseongensis TaxID=2908207 RepID=A0ABT0RG68_9SPHN|nr:alpha/beta fold hydrolase [Sphingomonas anseongensis]MCL6679228.1 alpha/beta fold hydrolase [Sphingomonas anseongensis]
MMTPLLLLASLAAQPATAAAPPPPPAVAQKAWPTKEGDVVLKDFRFRDGETLPELRIHYTTLGSPHRNSSGAIDNAVMVLHGTGGTGKQFLRPQFADELYGPGQPLDIGKYWIILPDNIGHGGSSKPSDGLRMKFPKYDYDDMVEAQHAMLRKLGVERLRLIMGTSMGCMHIFVWGETYPDFAKALMPLACEPIEIAGLNRMWRQMVIDGIEADPAWQKGNYSAQPTQGLRTAESILIIAGSAPLYQQAQYPTREKATAYVRQAIPSAIKDLDANDMIYQFDSSRNYNPWPRLEKITAPVMWVNSADDFINPRNLAVPQEAVKRMSNARFRLIPESSETHGHGTHTWAKFWKADLIELLERTN